MGNAGEPKPTASSFSAKFRELWDARPEPRKNTQLHVANEVGISFSTLRKWLTVAYSEALQSGSPERDWVERLVVGYFGFPPAMVDWLYNNRHIPPPVPIDNPGASVLSMADQPDAISDILYDRYADLHCLQPTGEASEFYSPRGRRAMTILKIPRSLMNEGTIGITVGSLDESLLNIAEQSQTVVIAKNSNPPPGSLVLGIKGDKAVLRVLRTGPAGYEFHFVNVRKYPATMPTQGWEIYGVAMHVIRRIGRGVFDASCHFEGIQV